ncbi:MAG: hypothetical protein QM582_05245, partial [Micropruina sp.]
WWAMAAAVLAAVVVVAVVWAARGTQQVAEVPSVTPPATASATPGEEPSDLPGETPSASPAPTSTRSLSPYCRDYLAILGGASGGTPDDDASPDTGQLSETFAKWLERYTAASKKAPAALQPHYAKVIRYLKDAKITIDSGDWNAVRAQLKQLPKLNKAMDEIETRSERLCR